MINTAFKRNLLYLKNSEKVSLSSGVPAKGTSILLISFLLTPFILLTFAI